MELVDDRTIKLNKPLSDLDLLVLRFIRIIEKYVEYVIISGYVAILFGRSRGTEDVDLFIRPITEDKFIQLYHHLKADGFWCLNAESDNGVYDYVKEWIALRFALKNQTIPNFEVKVARKKLDLQVFYDFITVKTVSGKLNISSLERQIAFKKYYLKSDKDLEDARHVENIFKEHLNKEKIKKYKHDIGQEYGIS